MGRQLNRVPLDFDHPIGEIWEGYCPTLETLQELFSKRFPYLMQVSDRGKICEACDRVHHNECWESADYCLFYNDDNRAKWFKEIPTGEGFQLWETTTEGSPISPVFANLEELCEWAATNATTFAASMATKEEWMFMLGDANHREGDPL